MQQIGGISCKEKQTKLKSYIFYDSICEFGEEAKNTGIEQAASEWVRSLTARDAARWNAWGKGMVLNPKCGCDFMSLGIWKSSENCSPKRGNYRENILTSHKLEISIFTFYKICINQRPACKKKKLNFKRINHSIFLSHCSFKDLQMLKDKRGLVQI